MFKLSFSMQAFFMEKYLISFLKYLIQATVAHACNSPEMDRRRDRVLSGLLLRVQDPIDHARHCQGRRAARGVSDKPACQPGLPGRPDGPASAATPVNTH